MLFVFAASSIDLPEIPDECQARIRSLAQSLVDIANLLTKEGKLKTSFTPSVTLSGPVLPSLLPGKLSDQIDSFPCFSFKKLMTR